MSRGRLVAIVAAVAVAGGASAAAAVSGGTSRHADATAGTAPDPVTLHDALAVSRRLGPLAPGRLVELVLSLRSRDQQELDRLLRTGRGGNGHFAAAFGPDPSLVRTALAAARRAGFRTRWRAGDTVAVLTGPASSVRRLFGVRLFGYASPSGRRFFAGDRTPTTPRALRRVVLAVSGLDDWAQARTAAITPGGVTPGDMLSFYDITPLRTSGLDGAGITVVFPELNSPADVPQLRRDLVAFAAKFKLPSFNLTVRTDPSWGATPAHTTLAANGLDEVAMDLEIVHSIAPAARLVIYEEGDTIAKGVLADTAMARENPSGIISDSIIFAECYIQSQSELRVVESPWEVVAANRTTHYDASGDSGAYDCGGESRPPSVDFKAAVPVNTAVGGTSVFLAQRGGYYRELAWGDPFGQTGGGGGVSRIFARPSFQQGPGFPSTSSAPGRLVPDVAGLGDGNTGWHIIAGGKDLIEAGTSAAAPLWAGITALIDQHLLKDGLHPVGLANRGLYWIAERNSRFHAFHDVTGGNNLLYDAGPGWDAATGWGTPDAAALDVAWHAYVRAGGG